MSIRNNHQLSLTQSFEEILEAVQPMITAIFTQLHIYKDFDYYRHIASIAVWRAWLKADPAKGQFSAYLYSSIKGEILNELSKEKNNSERITVVDGETLNFILSDMEGWDNQKNPSLLEIKLSQLKQIEREILLLYYVEGYSDQEIANALGLSAVAIKKRRGRIIQRLKHQLFKVE
ncbi:sigma-70 family RNA polymerase sigma factor [Lysinibacillus capsici]|uniref:RNA polymerase sigma factor n=1 Tax=Lysinibacillus capsici TaxID=2115968 RepID=UPI002E1CDE78|nr:sigma-70 family RNA polymerase sigma factor [Lysinibacillus capsici]